MIHWIAKVPTRILLHLRRIWMLSTSQRPLTKVRSSSTACISPPYLIFSIPIQDQLLKTRTSIVKRVRSVGKSSKPQFPRSPRSQSQSPHPPPLAVLPPTTISSPTAALSSSKSPIPTSPPDFSSQSPLSATTRARNLHYPSLSASDSDAFNQSETNYVTFMFLLLNH